MLKKYLILELEASHIKVLLVTQGKSLKNDHTYTPFQIFDNKNYYLTLKNSSNIKKEEDIDSFWDLSSDFSIPSEGDILSTYNQVSLPIFTKWLTQTYNDIDGVFVNIPSKNFYIREMSFPFTDLKKIEQVTKNEIALLLPYPIENFITRYYSAVVNSEKTDITLLNIDYHRVLSLLSAFKNANIRVEGIYAKQDILIKTFLEKSTSGLLCLDVGCESSTLVYILDKNVRYIRSIPIGYSRFIKKCLLLFKFSLEQIREICADITFKDNKLDLKDNVVFIKNKKQFIFILNSFLNQLVIEVKTSTRVLFQKDIDLKESYGYITSDFFLDSFFYEALKEKLSINVNSYFPNTIHSLRPSLHADFLLKNVSKILQTNNSINFLTPSLKKTMTFKKEAGAWNFLSLFYVVLGCILLFSSAILHYNLSVLRIHKYQDYNKLLFKELFGKEPLFSDKLIKEAQELLSIKESRLIMNKKYGGVSVSKLLEVVNSLVNELDVSFTKFQLKRQAESLFLTGNTNSYETFNRLKELLSKSEYFINVKPQKVRESAGKGLEKRVVFLLRVSLKKR